MKIKHLKIMCFHDWLQTHKLLLIQLNLSYTDTCTYTSLYVVLCPFMSTSGANHLINDSLLLSPLSILCAPMLNSFTSILVPTSTLRAQRAPCGTYNVMRERGGREMGREGKERDRENYNL